ncbi:MAG: hypothetical protein Q4A37_02635 [Candidatus Saccharibacteria bacterium]|nr:hypothetical protein [Candidatus Saccharibacteria bacterium]
MTQKKHTRPFRGERASSTGLRQEPCFRGGREQNFIANEESDPEVQWLVKVAMLAQQLQKTDSDAATKSDDYYWEMAEEQVNAELADD